MDVAKTVSRRKIPFSRIIANLVLISCALTLVRSHQPTTLDIILASGELRIISRNGPTTYYESPNGYTGFEYTLIKGFADELGVELVIEDNASVGDTIRQISRSTHHLAASAITVTPSRSKKVTFSHPFTEVSQQLIYHDRRETPADVLDLMGRDLVVVAQSSHAERLRELKATYPELSWRELPGVEAIDLLEMVHRGDADAAVVDSNAFELHRYAYSRAKVAFDISEPQQLAWAFPHSKDTSLFDAAQAYLTRIREDGSLQRITDTFFQPMPVIEEVTTSDALMFAHRLENRFPQWEQDLRAAGEKYDVDWKLLASISYQESHWDPNAVSYTGVRGLMMLTLATAREVGVIDRVDPTQSIYGGAQYFKSLLGRIPARVTDPEDRLYMALAAYNVGLGHLEDARVLTERHGDNPNKWEDVSKYLPLLAKQQYYTQAKHGYARGWEPVAYVTKVRSYHKILEWYSAQEERRLAVVQHDNRRDNVQAKSVNTTTLSRNNLNASALSVL